MWSIRTLFTASALALLAAGCATSKSGGTSGKERAPLPDEEEGWAPGSAHNASAAESGPADIPLAKKKASDRQITEEQKATFDRIVADYHKAKKTGVLNPADCSSLSSAFKKLANQAPALLDRKST